MERGVRRIFSGWRSHSAARISPSRDTSAGCSHSQIGLIEIIRCLLIYVVVFAKKTISFSFLFFLGRLLLFPHGCPHAGEALSPHTQKLIFRGECWLDLHGASWLQEEEQGSMWPLPSGVAVHFKRQNRGGREGANQPATDIGESNTCSTWGKWEREGQERKKRQEEERQRRRDRGEEKERRSASVLKVYHSHRTGTNRRKIQIKLSGRRVWLVSLLANNWNTWTAEPQTETTE